MQAVPLCLGKARLTSKPWHTSWMDCQIVNRLLDLEVNGAWWCPWSSKPVWGSQESWVGSIPIRLRHFFTARWARKTSAVFRLIRTILQRGLLPIVMLGLGIASLVWGAKHHILEIYEEQEIEISIAPPPEMMQPMGFPGGPDGGMEPGFDDPSGMGGPPPFMPGPPPEMQTVTQIVMVSKEEFEPQAVFEITIGGLAVLESGELQRTYSGQPPSLCPT